MKECLICKKMFDGHPLAKLCSEACRKTRKDQTRYTPVVKVKQCRICNTTFKPYRNSSVFCTPTCKVKNFAIVSSTKDYRARKNTKRKRKTFKKPCVMCGVTFNGDGRRRYCTKECADDAIEVDGHLQWHLKLKETKEQACNVCSQVFSHGRADKKTCSPKCKKAHVKTYKKKFNKNIISECVVCGVEFNKINSAITCSKECRQIQREHYRKKWTIETDYYDNPTVAISLRISNRLRATLKHKKIFKNNRTFEILGYSKEDLKEHFESYFTEENGYSWDNMGEWHIDHIRPVSSFNFTTTECEDFKKCWALENLQPLWAADNYSKGNEWDSEVNA